MEAQNIVLIGPPGAGKGTQAGRIADAYDIPHISTGRLLRENKHRETEYGTAAEYIDEGKLAPEGIVRQLLAERLREDDTEAGYILDGFPRSVDQAEYLEQLTEVEVALYMDASEEEVVERLSGRRICRDCEAVYNLVYDPPEEEGCDDCGGELKQREDDSEEAVRKRWETYEEKTLPVTDFYREESVLEEVDADQRMEAVWEDIRDVLEE